MGATEQVGRVRDSVTEQFSSVLDSDAFAAWSRSESIRADDLIICNNSFLFREGRSTTKSDKYLAAKADSSGKLTLPPCVVRMTTGINLQFKRISARQAPSYAVADLDTAVGDELPRLGRIVFSLAGRIGEAEPAEIRLERVPGLAVLRYAPDQEAAVEVVDDVVSLKHLDDLDGAWSAIRDDPTDRGFDRDALAERFEGAFQALQEEAGRSVDPADVGEDVQSILTNVLGRMEEQVAVYSTTLQEHRERPNDNEVYNELLRVAYNFADGARAFLGLTVGVCDLKPVMFWLTVSDQVELAHRFAKLPFSLVGKGKPSLDRYRSVIANARNRAFHDVFAFDHPFHVRLPSDALRAPELRLFRQYNKRGDPALTFEDRELVEIFASLTRTAERPVPLGFWDGNEDVMAAVVDVVRGLRRALVVASMN